jgi:hypothetical protein
MGGVGTVVLRPIEQSGYWRVEMTWPEHGPRYFGKFDSRADAEKWIEEHRWLATQNHEHHKTP